MSNQGSPDRTRDTKPEMPARNRITPEEVHFHPVIPTSFKVSGRLYLRSNYISNYTRYHCQPTRGKNMEDRVDNIIHDWHQRRTGLDFSPLEVVSRILRAAHYLQARLDEVAAAYGLSHTGDLDVLTNLDRAGPPYELTPSQLAEIQLVTAGGMTVRLNRLQQAGLIERRPNPNDGRGLLVRLNTLGQQIAQDALPRMLEAQATALRDLSTSEHETLTGLLRQLLVTLGDKPAFRPPIKAVRVVDPGNRSRD